MKTVVDVENLSLNRGGTAILDRVSWRVEPGEHWAVLGANGSGKTSLLSAVAGRLQPSAGNVSVFGVRRGTLSWVFARPRIGMVTSSLLNSIGDAQTVERAVLDGAYGAFASLRRTFYDDSARAARILRLVQCAGMNRRRWGTLSQGEKQRVLIGRALLPKPRLLILDEPCAGLDIVAREKFLRFLRHLGALPNGPTMLMATHHAEEIAPVFRHLLVMKKGRALESGRIEKTLTAETLSKAFGAAVRVKRIGRQYVIRRAGRSGAGA